MLGGVEGVFKSQPRVIRFRVVVERGRAQPFPAKGGYRPQSFLRAQHAVAIAPAQVSEQVVNGKPQSNLERRVRITFVNREEEGDGPGKVRGELQEQPPLPPGFVDELEIELFEVTQAAVDQLGRAAGSAARKVACLNQCHFQSA